MYQLEDWICILHGALILTNDGDMVYHVTHPKYEKTKTYVATLSGIITDEKIKNLKDGVVIGDYKTKEAKVRILKIDKEKKTSRIEVTIHEGKNKQVRKMCEAVGYPVMALHRSKIRRYFYKGFKNRRMEISNKL